ncbi:hypothetical protein [Vulcanisaeta sp. JCM 16161]|uniref:hypothetical protein n=1 Tax=Vulcanisaeta sp. JCM 16161 TaxID=1295372 RepID=UPI00406C898A
MSESEIMEFVKKELLRRINFVLDNPQYENLSNVNPYEYVNKVAPNKALVVNDVLEYYNFLKSLDSTIKGYTVHTMLPGIKQSLLSNNYMIKKVNNTSRALHVLFPNSEKAGNAYITIELNRTIKPSISFAINMPAISFYVNIHDKITYDPNFRKILAGLLATDGSRHYDKFLISNTETEIHALVAGLISAIAQRPVTLRVIANRININNEKEDEMLSVKYDTYFDVTLVNFDFLNKLNAFIKIISNDEPINFKAYYNVGIFMGDGIFNNKKHLVGFSLHAFINNEPLSNKFRSMLEQMNYKTVNVSNVNSVILTHEYSKKFAKDFLTYILSLDNSKIIFLILNHYRVQNLVNSIINDYNIYIFYKNYTFKIEHGRNGYYIQATTRSKGAVLKDFIYNVVNIGKKFGINAQLNIYEFKPRKTVMRTVVHIKREFIPVFIALSSFIAKVYPEGIRDNMDNMDIRHGS